MALTITETFYPVNRNEWRAWLTQHYADKTEIWVVFYKKHTGKPTLLYQDAVEEALCFGWIDGMERRMDDERYALRFTPRRPKSNWTEKNIEIFKRLEKEGLVTESGKKAFADRK